VIPLLSLARCALAAPRARSCAHHAGSAVRSLLRITRLGPHMPSSPPLWQTDVQADLQFLPIYLASCKQLVVLAGPTYLSRMVRCD
jgi:hypothetical protein